MNLLRLRHCFVLVAFFTSLAPATGGWYSKRAGDAVNAVPLGIEEAPRFELSFSATVAAALGQTGTPLPASELATLKTLRPFKDLSDADAQLRFGIVRRATLDAINLLSLDDARLGENVLQMYNNRRISIASGSIRAPAVFRRDTSGGDLSLNLYDFPCDSAPVKLFNPELVRLAVTLGHYGELASCSTYPGPEPVTLTQQASWALQNQIGKAFALTQDLSRITALVSVMESISNNLALPVNASGSAWQIGSAILGEVGLTSTQRRQTALDLWALLEGDLRPRIEHELNFRDTYRVGLGYYIGGQLPGGTSYNDWMKKTGWFSYGKYHVTGEFRYVGGYGGAGEFITTPSVQYIGDPAFTQIGVRSNGTKTQISWDVPLSYLSDARRWSNKLIIAGDDESQGQGVLRGYLDTDNDGFVEEATGRELLRSADFYGGVRIGWNPALDTFLLFNRKSANLYELSGSDADGFPTTFTPRGSISLRTDLLDFRLARDGSWAFASPDYDLTIGEFSKTAISRWNVGTSLFANYRVGSDFKEVGVNAALATSIAPGDSSVYATTTPGWTCSIFRWDGMTKVPLDTAQADPSGHMVFHLGSPLEAEDRVIIGNEFAGWWSPTYTVPDDAETRLLTPRRLPGNMLRLEAHSDSRSSQTFHASDNLLTWMPDAMRMAGRFGSSFLTTEITEERKFWQVEKNFASLSLGIDYYTAAPGLKSEYHPSFNDRLRAPSVFELFNGPTLDPERFSFSANGSFNYVGLTADLFFSFQYRVTSGVETSPPSTVTITMDYKALSNPPVERGTNGVDVVLVRCLVLEPGKHYPMYQFRVTNSTMDACGQPHWHSFGTVYPLEFPNTGVNDPDMPSCGFGTVETVPQATVRVPLDQFEDFKILHVPPL